MSSHYPLTPPLSAGLPTEGGNMFSGQISPHNYIVAAPSGAYDHPSPPIRYGDYNYAAMSYPPSGYSIANNYSSVDKQRESYGCDSADDIKPTITSTTSAFNIVAPPQYAANTSNNVPNIDKAVDNTPGSFQASTYSAFSPFESDHSSPLSQSPTQGSRSPCEHF